MERWGEVNNPLVKAVAGFAVPLFLALNFPAAFLVFMGGLLFYVIALLGVLQTYRGGHRIVGAPELAVRFMAKGLAGLKEASDQIVTRGLERRQRRRSLKRERKAKLKKYRRERNRKKRQQARQALAPKTERSSQAQ